MVLDIAEQSEIKNKNVNTLSIYSSNNLQFVYLNFGQINIILVNIKIAIDYVIKAKTIICLKVVAGGRN